MQSCKFNRSSRFRKGFPLSRMKGFPSKAESEFLGLSSLLGQAIKVSQLKGEAGKREERREITHTGSS